MDSSPPPSLLVLRSLPSGRNGPMPRAPSWSTWPLATALAAPSTATASNGSRSPSLVSSQATFRELNWSYFSLFIVLTPSLANSNGHWGTADVMSTLSYTATIPSSLAAGEYLIRVCIFLSVLRFRASSELPIFFSTSSSPCTRPTPHNSTLSVVSSSSPAEEERSPAAATSSASPVPTVPATPASTSTSTPRRRRTSIPTRFPDPVCFFSRKNYRLTRLGIDIAFAAVWNGQ